MSLTPIYCPEQLISAEQPGMLTSAPARTVDHSTKGFGFVGPVQFTRWLFKQRRGSDVV
eukprot:CAMPEP_0179169884 /NCGR_PEP_ID=MMETSP0796-20121207/83655_1 /TAXON_ID=73915 /ORGANISM="Pyrodinium bahamense, Strain pbaha01" /LENGTH=58 /DNA_ID=CAMNT_0020872799 /DNA_START=21 /DNA_END=193 /DNA_ORIENTATION=-